MLQYANLFTSKRVCRKITFGTALLVLSCQPQSSEIEMIAHQIKDNNCRIEQLTRHVDESWTVTLDRLDDMIPQDLPDQERDRMLVLKNADLLRMFRSYRDFDDDVHMLVDSMEQVDMQLADSVRNISLDNQHLEMKMDSLFALIGNAEMEDQLYRKVEEIKSGNCDTPAM